MNERIINENPKLRSAQPLKVVLETRLCYFRSVDFQMNNNVLQSRLFIFL